MIFLSFNFLAKRKLYCMALMGINNSMAICLYFKILALLNWPLFCFKWTFFKKNPSSIFFYD